MQKGFAPILIIIILAMVALGGYLVYQKQTKLPASSPQTAQSVSNETENWKTYTNTKYSYEFKYPSAWSLGETTENSLKINLPNELLKDYPYSLVIKWYKSYQDVEPIFKYNVQLKKWGYLTAEQPGDYINNPSATYGNFKELDKALTTDTGIPIYCLGNEGGASHLIPLSNNTFILIQIVGIGCLRDTAYQTPTDKVLKILKSFRLAL